MSEPADPNKYIVFKREDFLDAMGPRAMNYNTSEATLQAILRQALPDAVVIRRQDLFAGPALHAYASSIGIAAKLTDDERAKGLQNVADYFHDQAVLADEEGWKTPD